MSLKKELVVLLNIPLKHLMKHAILELFVIPPWLVIVDQAGSMLPIF